MNKAEPNFYQDPAVIGNPKAYFDFKRAQGPVAWEPYHGTLMVTGYDEALAVLNDKEGVFSNAASVVGPIPGLPFKPEGHDILAQLDAHRARMPWADHLVAFDGAKHAEYRGLMGGLLTFKRLKQNEDYLYDLVDRLIDGFIGKGAINAVPEYAHATTVYAISDLMGIPMEDRPVLLQQIGAPPSQLEGDVGKVGPDPLEAMKPLFDTYLRDRKETHRGDLMSDLMNTRLKDGSEPDFEVLSGLARFLFAAGQDTTSRLIAMGILILADDQELQARLRADPERVKDFIEECLRFDAPVKVSYRLATRDTRVGDVDVPAGTIVAAALMAASNDPAKFENPEQFNIDRPHVRDHMGFSRGPHGCLGAPLGRMESRIAIERLLARTSNVRLSEEHHGTPGNRKFNFEPTYTFRSLSDLYVEFDPA
ncbi:cytochrome P450 [Novosphingobium album (ex Hu et al. 2023)]|uniref:Cytochrome P450 n=1 Tax=Novosphingobium album (ex Hu et al. 2023) TaxID=2930093 RepID=A0ABT0B757_9SPHN|nr:cytochrome P450 [Novosphingobium album (ex Hu et al. 2023)]MCJ2180853.1 cytochrome P450 [Novosphingobium album (ex Hu et al. 2023)]